ncbi:nuclear transport factor 2 family protein [Gramella sp. BOM4]|nr:nuclear transport factor 2 family protein [Christiangramia bathymodioli]
MKKLIGLLCIIGLFSCDSGENKPEKPERVNSINMEKELASIEETRTNFQNAIAEKRYEDLSKYATRDLISLTPVCGEWEEYKKMVEDSKGLFSYDSIRMNPEETIILNDSIAYDFGTSTSYYTNSEGEPTEIKASFLAILKKDKKDGVWKLYREVATTNRKGR